MPTLEILSGNNDGQRFPCGTLLQVGKDPNCQVCLSDPGVSRHHAKITVEGNQAVIEDLGSSNGTYVNFKKRAKGERTNLSDKDIVFFGRTVAKFWVGEPGGPGGMSPDQMASQMAQLLQIEVIRRLRLHELDDQALAALHGRAQSS